MKASAELARLADLLRIGARAARQIATLRPHDASKIEHLAVQAEVMADELESLAVGPAWPSGAVRVH